MYELAHGYAPFRGKDGLTVLKGIESKQDKIKFRDGLSEDYKDLVRKMLEPDHT